MKEIKRRMETFLLYDKAGMVRQLEKMAADGWMLDKITTFFWQYKRIEPAQLHFEVTYLPKVSGFDSAPTLAQREYWDYCHYAGWELAASSAQMQIFYSTEDDPMPIETEPLVQLDNIRKTMKLQMIMFGIILFTFVMQVGLRLSMVLNYPIDELTDNMTFVILLLLLIAGLILAVDMVMYFVWLRKAKRMAVEENEFYETTSMTGVRKGFLFFVVLLVTVSLCIVCCSESAAAVIAAFTVPWITIAVVTGGLKLFKKLHFSRRTNLAVTIIGSLVLYGAFIGGIVHFAVEHADETEIEGGTAAPLLVSQLYDVDESAYEIDAEEQHSVAAGFVRYDASPKEYGEDDETPGLAYRVTTVKLPFIYDLCMDGIFREFEEYKADFGNGIKEEYKEIDAAPWGAEKAYCMYYRGENQYQYIICWPDKIAEIRLYSEPTDEQVHTMAEKLK